MKNQAFLGVRSIPALCFVLFWITGCVAPVLPSQQPSENSQTFTETKSADPTKTIQPTSSQPTQTPERQPSALPGGLMFAVRGTGQGAVVMANSDTGMQLIFEIFRAIATVYDWPVVEKWRVAQRAEGRWVEVDPAVFALLQGDYQVQNLTVSVVTDQEKLWIQIPSRGPAYPLYPDSEMEFFTADGAQFVFEKDGSGEVSTLHMNGWGDMELTAHKTP